MNQQELVEALRSQRQSLGMTQADLGVAMSGKKMQTHIARIETGHTNVTFRSILEYAAVVGLQLVLVADPAGPKVPPHRVKLEEYKRRVTGEARFRTVCKTCAWKSPGDERKYTAVKAGDRHKRETVQQ